MDDLLREFLTETNESLDRIDAELVRFEQKPTATSSETFSGSYTRSKALAAFSSCRRWRRWRTPPKI